jgi:ApaG protein
MSTPPASPVATIAGVRSKAPLGSIAVTDGVRVAVTPHYIAEQSDPAGNAGRPRFTFGYDILITNTSPRTLQLISRRWVIIDSRGQRCVVVGEGVVGRQPILPTGASFAYSSFCPLETRWGTMEGTYQLRVVGHDAPLSADDDSADAEILEVEVARFYLVAPDHA